MNKYICDKENQESVCGYLDYEKINGLKIKPKNNVRYEGIEVGKLILVNPNFIGTVLKRKIKRRLTTYLKFLINMIEDSDTDPDSLTLILNDVKQYKSYIINRYAQFLEPKYIKELLVKVKFVEDELKNIIYEQQSLYIYSAKSRGR